MRNDICLKIHEGPPFIWIAEDLCQHSHPMQTRAISGLEECVVVRVSYGGSDPLLTYPEDHGYFALQRVLSF